MPKRSRDASSAHLAYVWATSAHLAYAWHIYGIYATKMAYLWHMPGIILAYAWHMPSAKDLEQVKTVGIGGQGEQQGVCRVEARTTKPLAVWTWLGRH